ncbi:DNA-3-methyladenine glycosylase I [Litorihabitans aurantiacus]|uniref:DNA-3-methyladenine glycosylase I n=1 Tax=Litorihabitans aurantiacus TaxID=1930061 RepID=A0AA38CWM3_9MICO|nr:DNA-3-methyladenine glycosylase I [Litorihabitans aurantiacus]GMA33282.1 DNA-3-methyladenine glycosylase I [Litorihabitans aurantiacus]
MTEIPDADPAVTAATRCFGDGDPLYEAYHDDEWGVAFTDGPDERELLERLALEAFQSGLSWITVLRKRDAFRAAFADFDPAVVAAYDDADVERLMADAGIVRNRAKITATIAGARAVVAMHERGERLRDTFERYRPEHHPVPATAADVPGSTPASAALAKDLKALGFRFVGPTTAYAAMQAIGVVDDHPATCPSSRNVRRRGLEVTGAGAR